MSENQKASCPICGSKNQFVPTDIDCVTLYFKRKGTTNINNSEQISARIFICEDCNYIMLFKK